ncbi:MAG: hypothetical protein K2Y14_02100 [Burkholderiales bacterium]|nr:hypothetical protein [Burkholderiales bacterium]
MNKTVTELAIHFGLARSTIVKYTKECPTFPQPSVKTKVPMYDVNEVNQFIQNRNATNKERRAKQGILINATRWMLDEKINTIMDNINKKTINNNLYYEFEDLCKKVGFTPSILSKTITFNGLLVYEDQERMQCVPQRTDITLYFKNEDIAKLVVEASFKTNGLHVEYLVNGLMREAEGIRTNAQLGFNSVINLTNGDLSNNESLVDEITYTKIETNTLEKLALALIKRKNNIEEQEVIMSEIALLKAKSLIDESRSQYTTTGKRPVIFIETGVKYNDKTEIPPRFQQKVPNSGSKYMIDFSGYEYQYIDLLDPIELAKIMSKNPQNG